MMKAMKATMIARSGFAEVGNRVGLEHHAVLEARLRAANGMLTGARWSAPSPSTKENK